MDNYLEKINGHFLSFELNENKEPQKMGFISNIDDTYGDACAVHSFYKIKIYLFIYNLLEFFKHKIKSRTPLYKYFSMQTVFFKGALYVNHHNGTAVLLEGNDKVVKYFFKDKDYFEKLYEIISPLLNYKSYYYDNVFVVEQAKYLKSKNGFEFLVLANKLKFKLDNYHDFLKLNTTSKDIFIPEYKILQIMGFYNYNGDLIFEYTGIARELLGRVDKLDLGFCHGDLWSENILQNQSEEIQLIDYDKSIYYCKRYDFVYLYLMTRKVKLSELSENFEIYSNEVYKFFKESGVSILENVLLIEIKFCLYLFVFLKLTEQDFRNKKIGESIDLLNKILETKLI